MPSKKETSQDSLDIILTRFDGYPSITRKSISRKRKLFNLFRVAAIRGSFIAALISMFYAALSVETFTWRSLVIFAPSAAWFLLVGLINDGTVFGRRASK